MKKLILYAILIGAIFISLVIAQAEDVEITTADQLSVVVDSACMQAMQLQSGSQALCHQIKNKLLQQLKQQLQQQGNLIVDPQFLGETISWMFNWQRQYKFTWQEESVPQLALQLMNMHHYGVERDTIHELVLQAEQSGYTTSETAYMCTRLRQLMDTQIASEVLGETVECLKDSAGASSVDDIIDTVQQRIQQKHQGSDTGCTSCTGDQGGDKGNTGSGNQKSSDGGSTHHEHHGGKSGK